MCDGTKFVTPYRTKSKGKIFSFLVLFTVSLMFAGCFGSHRRSAQKHFHHIVKTNQIYDAIIVPGIPFTGDSLGHLMRSRVLWSWVLYKNGITRNVIYSGGAVHTPYHEAKVMGLYAQQLGIPAENIFYDTCALHSTENVYYSYQIARQNGFRKLAVATDIYQSFFLKHFIKKRFKNTIQQLPIIKDSLSSYAKIYLSVDEGPARIANADNFIPLGKKENYWQRMRGTLGWNIVWNQTVKTEQEEILLADERTLP